jgi:phosphatidylserine/phosphatidylglycerophosphate/cardiolipin synthase-like enzyme
LTPIYGFFTQIPKEAKSVIIGSPFITWNRVQDVKPNISNMLQRGVRIQIITRPVEDAEFGVSALQFLQQLGCIIHQRKRTHEKVVIIDTKIAYLRKTKTVSDIHVTRPFSVSNPEFQDQ